MNLELNQVSARLVEHAIQLKATPEAMDQIAADGYDPDMGARPLKRVIQQKIEDSLSDAMLSGEFANGDTILVDMVDGQIELRREEPVLPEELVAV